MQNLQLIKLNRNFCTDKWECRRRWWVKTVNISEITEQAHNVALHYVYKWYNCSFNWICYLRCMEGACVLQTRACRRGGAVLSAGSCPHRKPGPTHRSNRLMGPENGHWLQGAGSVSNSRNSLRFMDREGLTTTLTRARHWTLPEPVESSSHPHTLFLQDPF
jgi:hypothetical protein